MIVRGDLLYGRMVLTPEQERLTWLAGSVLLYVLARNVAWAMPPVPHWPIRLRVLAGIARFAYYVGLPYLALLFGVVTLQSLGLVSTPQGEPLTQGAVVAAGAVALLGLIGWYYRREVIKLRGETTQPLQVTRRWLDRPWGWVLFLIKIAYQQAHWAFYRALPFLILDDHYAGSFIGLALVLLEAYADPRVRRDLTDPAGAEWLLFSAGFALMTTVLSVLTGTSWLGAATHFAAAVGWVLFARAHPDLRRGES